MAFFERNILATYGEAGEIWLKELPHLLTTLSHHWGLTSLNPVVNLSFNYVAAGKRGDVPIILKIGMDKKSLAHEAAALKVFQSHGSIHLLEDNLSMGALLLEQAMPGDSLKSFFPEKDAESVKITANIIQRLHQAALPLSHSFPTLEGWLAVLERDWDIPKGFLIKARRLKEKLLRSASSPVLLHGDLHHDNIIRQNNHWIVIDPKGIVGDPLFETTTFLYNPLPDFLNILNPKERLQQRIHLFAKEFQIQETRLTEWAFVKAVLSLCWVLEDNLEPKEYLEYIEILNSIYS